MSDDRFRSTGEEGIDYQLPVQFLNTIIATPTFSDDIQMELMKVQRNVALFSNVSLSIRFISCGAYYAIKILVYWKWKQISSL